MGDVVRVLVIDDHVETANGLREVLALEGYATEVAYGGAQGLERARAFVPDIVLCDIAMPEINGLEVAHTLRADHELGHVRLVAFTGRTERCDIAAGRAAGFDLYLVKPVLVEDLIDALTKLTTSTSARTG